MKAYLLIYNDAVGTQDQVKAILNKMPEITHWRYEIPHSFYLISELEAQPLAEKIRLATTGKGMLAVFEVTKAWGWLSPETWYLITNKKYKAKEEK